MIYSIYSRRTLAPMKSCPNCQKTYPADYSVCPRDGTALLEVGTWSEGTTIRGKYRILSKVGQGGMGAVYRALHLRFNEVRALKVISAELASDPKFVKRFEHEAVITRKLQHPNAVRVDDIDETEDGRPFIVMEFIEGRSLKRLIQECGPMPTTRVCSIVKQVASALDAAHALGMVHRDIKPENIVLIAPEEGRKGRRPQTEGISLAEEPLPQETAKVLDFGIAKIKEASLGTAAGITLTGAGWVVGTPQYMSPEQAIGKRGEELDARSDIYSLGIVMYQMLTGQLPFKADTPMEMVVKHLQAQPTPIQAIRSDLHIPETVAGVVMRCLDKSPDARPASAKVLIEQLEHAETTDSGRTATAGGALDAAEEHRRRGDACWEKSDSDGAIQEYREAIRLRPDLADARVGLGGALQSKGDWDGAIAEYREAIRLKPNKAVDYRLSLALRQKRDRDGRIAEEREAMRLKPELRTEFAEWHYNKGIRFYNRMDYDTAIAEYREALLFKPDYAAAHYCLGLALESRGDRRAALEEYRKAYELAPQDAVVRANYERLSNELNK